MGAFVHGWIWGFCPRYLLSGASVREEASVGGLLQSIDKF